MRRRRRRAAPPVSLFPFLAVLVSTVGALVLLLLIFNRQAAEQALAALLDRATSQRSNLLKHQRSTLSGQVAESRQRLTAATHQRDAVRQRLAEAEQRFKEHERRSQQAAGELKQVRQRRLEVEGEVKKLAGQVERLRQLRAELHRRTETAERSFVPVLRAGKHATPRRPIFIECLADAIVVQPEGVRLLESDLETTPGGPQPLPAVIQVLSKYWATVDGQGEEDGEAAAERQGRPYPLLLVRPDGIGAFYAARRALERAGIEFGYELIERDWQLRYPAADPQARRLALTTLGQVRAARRRRLAAGLPAGTGSGPAGGGSGRRFGPTGSGGRTTGTPGSGHGQAGTTTTFRAGASNLPGTTSGREGTVERAGAGTGHVGMLGGSGLGGHGGGDNRGQRPASSAAGDGSLQAGSPADSPTGPAPPHGASDQPPTTWAATSPSSTTPPGSGRSPGPTGPPAAAGSGTCPLPSQPRLGPTAESPLPTLRPPLGARLIAITRTIRVELAPGRLAFGSGQAVLSTTEPTERVVEQVLAEVARHQARWGSGGSLFYWQPRLLFRLSPDTIETYYRLRFPLVAAGLQVDRELVVGEVAATLAAMPAQTPGWWLLHPGAEWPQAALGRLPIPEAEADPINPNGQTPPLHQQTQ